ncbi:hypothetical protein MDIS_01690 [Mesomycoplasma dispar]|nr:hypothetical protein MDIS_01690 [Mesomycoplasma dispar]
MNGLISTRGKNKSPPKSKKQYTINDLSENKRRIYQEIMENNIQQSMSPKGNALANRPIEYFYAILQREYLNVEGKIFENLEDAHQKISSFVKWYQKTRVQNCFSYLRPNSHFEQFDTQKNFHNFGE